MDEVGLGNKLQNARQKAKLTQQELCQRADISYSTLAKIERGAIKAPSIFTIEKIASVLGVGMDELLGRLTTPTLPPAIPKKVAKNGVKFVYFDVNGCLVRFFHHAFTRISEEFNVSVDSVESTFWHYNDAICKGEMSLEEFNKRLAETLRVNTVDWTDYYMEEVDPIEEMHELLDWASQHYHIGLLTNIMPGYINEMLEKGLIPNVHYDSIIDSSIVGAIKPEEEIFAEAESRSACQPNEILLVDDSRVNVIAAEKRGWRVLWFDDYRPQESIKRVKDALEFEG
jgi:HAD superfamily hydrolase (TIGR01509 family)